MRYHNITKDDMLNGEGLRVVLWCSGCEHHCVNCQNPITWDINDGLKFDHVALEEIENELKKPYINGITFSGGDPLHPENRRIIYNLCKYFKECYPRKTIWIYTGYTWDSIKQLEIMSYIDVLVDGKFVESLKDNQLHWRGSSNQKVIDVQTSLQTNKLVLYDE